MLTRRMRVRREGRSTGTQGTHEDRQVAQETQDRHKGEAKGEKVQGEPGSANKTFMGKSGRARSTGTLEGNRTQGTHEDREVA